LQLYRWESIGGGVEYGYWLTGSSATGNSCGGGGGLRAGRWWWLWFAGRALVVVVCGPGGVLCEFGQGEEMDRFF
jgi:hypothetical protein